MAHLLILGHFSSEGEVIKIWAIAFKSLNEPVLTKIRKNCLEVFHEKVALKYVPKLLRETLVAESLSHQDGSSEEYLQATASERLSTRDFKSLQEICQFPFTEVVTLPEPVILSLESKTAKTSTTSYFYCKKCFLLKCFVKRFLLVWKEVSDVNQECHKL